MVTQTRSYLGWTRQPRPPTYEESRLVRDARLQDPQVLDEIDRVLGLEHHEGDERQSG